jgi:hypothetical protein
MLKLPEKLIEIVDCKRISQGYRLSASVSHRPQAVDGIGPGVFSMASLFALPALLSEKQGPGGMLCVRIRRIRIQWP